MRRCHSTRRANHIAACDRATQRTKEILTFCRVDIRDFVAQTRASFRRAQGGMLASESHLASGFSGWPDRAMFRAGASCAGLTRKTLHGLLDVARRKRAVQYGRRKPY